MKFFKDMLTESDNSTWCMIRVGGFACLVILIILTIFAAVHYGVSSAAAFDPSKISDTLNSFCDNTFKVLETTVGGVVVKKKFGSDAPTPAPQ